MNKRTECHFWKWGLWFRIRGWGLLIDGDKGNPPMFSERHGYVKVWRGFGLRVKVLKP